MEVNRVSELVATARDGDRARKVRYPTVLRRLQVLGREPVGSGLLRISLGGPELEGLVSHAVDEHVKLLFPDPLDGELRLPTRRDDELLWPSPRPTSRDYSVRRVTADALEIDVVVHEGGLAAAWARDAPLGSDQWLVGPPEGLVIPAFDAYVFAADLSAAPVVARWLEQAPADARGWAVIEVADATEEFPLPGPPGMEVIWVHRGDAAPGTTEVLAEAVAQLPVPPGAFVWVAGEATCIRPLRRWARDDLGLSRGATSISGYWKRGTAGTPA